MTTRSKKYEKWQEIHTDLMDNVYWDFSVWRFASDKDEEHDDLLLSNIERLLRIAKLIRTEGAIYDEATL